MAHSTAPQQGMAYGTNPPPVVININQQNTPVVTAQPRTGQPTPRELEAQQPRGSSSFLGRMVEKITQSRRYQEAADYTRETLRSLKEMAIDICGALKILGNEIWKGASYGALGGLGGGMAITVLCPPLVGTAFTACITAGITAGGIIGIQIGLDKAFDHFNAARKARSTQAQADLIQQPAPNEVRNPFLEQHV